MAADKRRSSLGAAWSTSRMYMDRDRVPTDRDRLAARWELYLRGSVHFGGFVGTNAGSPSCSPCTPIRLADVRPERQPRFFPRSEASDVCVGSMRWLLAARTFQWQCPGGELRWVRWASGCHTRRLGTRRAPVGGRRRLDPGFEVRARRPLDQNRNEVAHRAAVEGLVVSLHDRLEGVRVHLRELLAE